jgi:hypothetical protein
MPLLLTELRFEKHIIQRFGLQTQTERKRERISASFPRRFFPLPPQNTPSRTTILALALFQFQHMRNRFGHFVEMVGNIDQINRSLLAKLIQKLNDALSIAEIQSLARFVENKQDWRLHQGTRQKHKALLANRHCT